MIDLTKLTPKEKEVLRKLVIYTCENCFCEESEVGTLQIHRLKRNTHGGIYHLRNIRVICDKCHKKFHENEGRNVKSK